MAVSKQLVIIIAVGLWNNILAIITDSIVLDFRVSLKQLLHTTVIEKETMSYPASQADIHPAIHPANQLTSKPASQLVKHTTKDYCLDQKFEATCPNQGVIMIENALYGRMTFGSCVKRDYGYIGCSVDVTAILANKCSARQSCEVVNFETLFAAYNGCPGDLKSYLQASYYCKQITSPLDTKRCTSGYVEPLPPSTGESGFLSPSERRWGFRQCPWRIRVRPGQRVNLTLHDYSDFGIRESDQPAVCRQYIVISDGDNDRVILACSHEIRSRTVYLSATNDIKVYFKTDPKVDTDVHFLLEFRAEGCQSPVLPANSYIVHEADSTVTIQCNYSLESWKLRCNTGKWQGTVGNCTATRTAQRTEHLVPLAVLVIGFFVLYFRRRKRHRLQKEEARYLAVHDATLNKTSLLTARTKHASLEKWRPSYSPLNKTRTIRTSTKAGEYTHIWQLKHPIPVATPEVPKTHTFRREVMTSAKSSPTMTCARSPILPERHRDRDHPTRDRQAPTFSTFKPGSDPYGIPPFRGQLSQDSGHSTTSSPLYFEIDTQRRKATNHYST
ncbi:hypothetical protein LSH36_432g02030 [Paralvinella palmiformis]|uniref:SUEL-type lectin domain-containing protein n=1 Tax=Paralvinella palmiformis TaxID=53620 RepID=A0AAD9MZY0_9ANNE|nr:hypothetical protein LSH36_432g02030 [Paralvinella palmiformis]